MITFVQKQRRIFMSIVASLGVTALLFASGLSAQVIEFSHADRFKLAATCLSVLGLCLSACIGIVACQRLRTVDAIDGQTAVLGALAINLRILQNTLEQVVLAALAYVAFAFLAPSAQLGLLPLLTGWFVAARICFAIGYHLGDNWRAFGFASTFLPTLGLLLYDGFLAGF